GCAACDYVGYMGRTGLYEFMVIDETVREMILDRAMAIDLRRHARRKQGMLTLREEGIMKCAKGITSPLEILDHTDKYED
ncbi:MAG: type II/IV secretion system protein, partial [Candidatus Hydrogenedens sp.]|nr:type II/IV secretion system protein [Candidatus Hydrogenedens sp.]